MHEIFEPVGRAGNRAEYLRAILCVVVAYDNSRSPIRRIRSSERVADSRNPRALAICVSADVMELVMGKLGEKPGILEFSPKRPALEGGEETLQSKR